MHGVQTTLTYLLNRIRPLEREVATSCQCCQSHFPVSIWLEKCLTATYTAEEASEAYDARRHGSSGLRRGCTILHLAKGCNYANIVQLLWSAVTNPELVEHKEPCGNVWPHYPTCALGGTLLPHRTHSLFHQRGRRYA